MSRGIKGQNESFVERQWDCVWGPDGGAAYVFRSRGSDRKIYVYFLLKGLIVMKILGPREEVIALGFQLKD